MKKNEIKDRGRYVAKINGVKTVIVAYMTRGGLRYRDERTNRFCSASPAKCWRPVKDWESCDSETVTVPSCREHREAWDGARVWVPVWSVVTLDEPETVSDDCIDFAAWSYSESLSESNKRLQRLAG